MVVLEQRLKAPPLLPTHSIVYQSTFTLLPRSLDLVSAPQKTAYSPLPLPLKPALLLSSPLPSSPHFNSFLRPHRRSQPFLSLSSMQPLAHPLLPLPALFHAPPPHQSLSAAALKQDKWIWILYNKTFRMESFVQVNSSQA